MAKTKQLRKWTTEEIDFLSENYATQTARDIAKALDRTPDSVWEYAGRLKLRKHAKRHMRDEHGPWHCPKCDKSKPKEEFGKRGRSAAYCTICINRMYHERKNNRNV